MQQRGLATKVSIGVSILFMILLIVLIYKLFKFKSKYDSTLIK